jgi:hypothetical protein
MLQKMWEPIVKKEATIKAASERICDWINLGFLEPRSSKTQIYLIKSISS